jgi:predicted glycoside hydrolase/deacetylase ChbG (UPF0249 family)
MKGQWLIVVADDLGLSPEVDAGILETIQAGTVTTADLLVNPPYSADTGRIVAAGAALGLHWNLTHGSPCADPREVPSLVDAAGRFLSRREELLARLSRADAERELRRQLECFHERVGRPPCHLSLHKHLHAHDAGLLRLVATLARECGVPLRSVDAGTRAACRALGILTNDYSLGEVHPAPYWTLARLCELAATAAEGVTELMCHPGREVKPIPGLWYLAERDTERETFSAPEARELLSAWRLSPCTAALFGDSP